MTKINMYEKANLIKSDRELVLDKVVGSMIDNFNNLSRSIPTHDKRVEKAINMLSDLTIKLVNETNINNIYRIRGRINYYIDKIKKLTKKLDDKFYDNLFLYRDDITEYVRIRKRNNLKEITNIDFNNITKEEKTIINNLLNKEKHFNKRLLDKYNNTREIKDKRTLYAILREKTILNPIQDGDVEFEIIDEIKTDNQVKEGVIEFKNITFNTEIITNNVDGNIEFENISEDIKNTNSNIIGDIEFEEIKENKEDKPNHLEGNIEYETIDFSDYKPHLTTEGSFKYDEDLTPTVISNDFENMKINARLIALINAYKLVRTNKYTNKPIINIKNLIINIPKYIKNKLILKRMKKDYSTYSNNNDLHSLMRFIKYDNSFKYAFGEIFNCKDLEVERAKKYRNILENIYSNMPKENAKPEDFKYRTLKKRTA